MTARCLAGETARCPCSSLRVGERACDADAGVLGACVCPPPPHCESTSFDCHMCNQIPGCGWCASSRRCVSADTEFGRFVDASCPDERVTYCPLPVVDPCGGRRCGDDGRGGSCGECPAGQTCRPDGRCQP